jgi:carbon starvation protein CstA
MKSEREARSSFYGMMVAEGLIAMVWAGAALAFFNFAPEWMGRKPAVALEAITTHFLSRGGGMVTVISVIVLAITSGDTAMRSLRLSLAEILKVDQKPILRRIAVCVPVIIIVCFLLAWSNKNAESFNVLWNYFAWGNQVLGAFTLIAGSVWLFGRKRFGWITLLPGMFMTFIIFCYILWIAPDKGKGAGSAVGFGLDMELAMVIAAAFAVIAGAAAVWRGRKMRSQLLDDLCPQQ